MRHDSHHSGQVCGASSRVLVQEGIYDEFMEHFIAAVSSMRQGDGFRENVDQGPIASQAHLDVRCVASLSHMMLTPLSASSVTSSLASEKEPVS